MHGGSRLPIALLAALAFASSAQASTLAILSSTLSLDLQLIPTPLPMVSLPGNASSLAVSSGAGTFTLSKGAFGPTNIPLPRTLFTGVSQLSGLTLVGFGNGTQPCTGTGPTSCGGGLTGTALVNVLQLFNLSIPLAVVGSPGASVMTSAGGIRLTVLGQGWRAGTATVMVTNQTSSGTTTATFTAQGSDARTSGHGGSLTLVTGFQVLTNVNGNFPGFATQTFQFAPEPVELLLLGVGLASFGLYAVARRPRR